MTRLLYSGTDVRIALQGIGGTLFSSLIKSNDMQPFFETILKAINILCKYEHLNKSEINFMILPLFQHCFFQSLLQENFLLVSNKRMRVGSTVANQCEHDEPDYGRAAENIENGFPSPDVNHKATQRRSNYSSN